MSKPIPIPLSAKRTDVFTPESLKPQPVVVADDEAEGGTRETGEFTGGEREIAFVLRIPTPSERDLIGTRLFELGLTSVTQETIRATMIDELYNIDWAESYSGPPVAYDFKDPAQRKTFNEEVADGHAEFLDGYWQRQTIEEHATTLWQEQEAQRLLDEAEGVVKEPKPQPARSIKVREHSKAKLLIDDMMERSHRVRALVARQMDYGRRNAELMVRLHLLALNPAEGVELPEDIRLDRDETGLVTVDSIDALREHIGREAWAELVDRIDNHYQLAEEERKNSDSPLGKPSDQTGSPEQSGASGTSDGSSTASSTGPAPSDESGMTTGKSSGSSSGNGGEKKKLGRTGGG